MAPERGGPVHCCEREKGGEYEMALQNIHQFLINVVFGKLGFQKGTFVPFMETKTESVEKCWKSEFSISGAAGP